ncbi:hypothetical protein [Bacillus toyonensis]|uniref:hypothetical protein n=1 Tax=Bacillus toyonensis TaxID=155322 RepID=UPI002E1F2684|nr:hypothetical protein [Bacillus toyonensis]
MPFFSIDKENNRIVVSPDAKPEDFIAGEFGFVELNETHYIIHPMNSEGLSKQEHSTSLIYGSKLVSDPCEHCERAISRMFMSENCSPCKFNYSDHHNRTFTLNIRKLQTSLLEKGYFRTSLSQFNYSMWKSNN